MGDLIMSSPAIRALKESFGCRITLLIPTSAYPIAAHLESIDEVIAADLPWAKNAESGAPENFSRLIHLIREKQFDGAVIFTVYSQNPLPAAMCCYMAGIPRRLAWCRENPYHLLTDWAAEKEPYSMIRHQVQRDLRLVSFVGAETKNDKLSVRSSPAAWQQTKQKLASLGITTQVPWMVMHTGVSEAKRQYPAKQWIEAGRKISRELGLQILLTGAASEQEDVAAIAAGIGGQARCLAGLLDMEEFIALIRAAPFVITVNTITSHIAAAVCTPVLVLYALTNPQHTPWKVQHRVLPFHPPEEMQSRNEVVQYVYRKFLNMPVRQITPTDILQAVRQLQQEQEKVSFAHTGTSALLPGRHRQVPRSRPSSFIFKQFKHSMDIMNHISDVKRVINTWKEKFLQRSITQQDLNWLNSVSREYRQTILNAIEESEKVFTDLCIDENVHGDLFFVRTAQ